jgi:hypothetical protein
MGAKSMKKHFELGSSIWFFVTVEGDKVLFIEEHDWHEGGGLPKPQGRDWTKDDFVKIVLGRFSENEGPTKDWLEKRVRDFLDSDELRYNANSDPACPWFKPRA